MLFLSFNVNMFCNFETNDQTANYEKIQGAKIIKHPK